MCSGPILIAHVKLEESDLLQTTDKLLANAHTRDSSSSVGDSLSACMPQVSILGS